MISRTLLNPVEETVPPVPLTWKNSDSLNSQASVVCATNSVSSERYSRRRPCTTQKKTVLASLRSRSDMLPDTSSMKNTTACTAGCLRRASCRKRRSSSVKVGVARGAPVPALADPVAVVGRTGARLEIGQLHLLPQPVDDVVDLELEQQLHLALVTAAGALLARSLVARRIGEHVAGLGLALARALLLLGTAQPEVIVLEHAHRHAHGAGAVIDDFAAGDDVGEIGAHRLADLLVVAQPVARAAREQLVPFRGAGFFAALAARFVHALLVLLFGARRYSWASSVVT